MRNCMILLLLANLILTGCSFHAGKVWKDGKPESAGVTLAAGQGTGPSGISGGAISSPVAAFLGKLIAQAMTFIPGVDNPAPPPPPVVIQHRDSESKPLSAPSIQWNPKADPGERYLVTPGQDTLEVKPWASGGTISAEEYQALLDE
jgi:hypothetical protein